MAIFMQLLGHASRLRRDHSPDGDDVEDGDDDLDPEGVTWMRSVDCFSDGHVRLTIMGNIKHH